MEPDRTHDIVSYDLNNSVYEFSLGPLSDDMGELIKSIQEISPTNDGKRHPLHPKQKTFLELLKENKNGKYILSDQDNICIIHCLKYNHYSDIHRDTLNKLIRKYAK